MRTIKVYSTRGVTNTNIETDVTTWGLLKPILEDKGYELDTLLATESINKTDLAHKDAILPTGDFVLFLRPTTTKSGIDWENASYTELRNHIKSAKDNNDTDFLNYIGNYTIKSTQTLRDNFVEYYSKPKETDTQSDLATLLRIVEDINLELEYLNDSPEKSIVLVMNTQLLNILYSMINGKDDEDNENVYDEDVYIEDNEDEMDYEIQKLKDEFDSLQDGF